MTAVFQHILVPVDFSEKNKHAFELALKIAQQVSSKVTLLHVIEIIADTTYDEFSEFYQPLEERAWQGMETLLASYQEFNKELDIEKRIQYGNRVREIVDYATEQAVDLIVMSSHTFDVDDPASGWGTISYKVSILADCPTLLVK